MWCTFKVVFGNHILIFKKDLSRLFVQLFLKVGLRKLLFELTEVNGMSFFELNTPLKLVDVFRKRIFSRRKNLLFKIQGLFLKKAKKEIIQGNFRKTDLLNLILTKDHIKVNTWTRTRNFQSHNLALYQLSYTYLYITK